MNTLTEFLLDRIAEQPVADRIQLYRALAVETKDAQLAETCRSLADELEEVERRHVQFVLDFKRRNS